SIVSIPATLTLLRHPLITRHPLSQTTSSSMVTFSVLAAGAGTLRYQWLFNGEPLSGATNAALVLTNVFLPATGDYQVRVTDDLGSISSQSAHLAVLARPRVEFHP